MVFIIFGGALLGGLAGGIGQGAASLAGTGITAAMAKAEARRNRAFQERMSSTAYQRAMDDMRKAGLNPILAYKQGGASSPGGAMANIPDFGRAAEGISKGAHVGSAIALNKANVANVNAQTRVNSAQAAIGEARAQFLLSPQGKRVLEAQEAGRITNPAAYLQYLWSSAKDAGVPSGFKSALDVLKDDTESNSAKSRPLSDAPGKSGDYLIFPDGSWRKNTDQNRRIWRSQQ